MKLRAWPALVVGRGASGDVQVDGGANPGDVRDRPHPEPWPEASSRARWSRRAGCRPGPGEGLPPDLPSFVLRMSARHHIALAVLSALLFGVGVVPLALQRRIVDLAVGRADVATVAGLAALYLGVVLGEGFIKLGLSLYRARVGEVATRWLRLWALGTVGTAPATGGADRAGTGIAVLVAEAEPVGAFVGTSVSEPLLQAGLLLGLLGYLTDLQPLLGLLGYAVLLPQGLLVPPMQRAINARIGARILELRAVSGTIAAGNAGSAVTLAGRIERVLRVNLGMFGLKYALNFTTNGFQHLGVTAVLMVGGILVASGRTDIGTVVASVSGLAKVNDPWGELVDWFREFYATRAKYALIARSVLAR